MGTPTDDLYIRWTQISISQSHLRFHGAPPQYRKPWNFSKDTQDKVRSILNLRYRLIPYIYSESHVAASEGLPVLRAMVLEFQNDRNVHNMEDQFMCGRNIMDAPIIAEGNTRNIYIPEGLCYDYQTGQKYTGPQWISETCDIERIPFFIRGGTILPLGKEVQNTTEIDRKDLTLKIYPDAEGLSPHGFLMENSTQSNYTRLVYVSNGYKNICKKREQSPFILMKKKRKLLISRGRRLSLRETPKAMSSAVEILLRPIWRGQRYSDWILRISPIWKRLIKRLWRKKVYLSGEFRWIHPCSSMSSSAALFAELAGHIPQTLPYSILAMGFCFSLCVGSGFAALHCRFGRLRRLLRMLSIPFWIRVY